MAVKKPTLILKNKPVDASQPNIQSKPLFIGKLIKQLAKEKQISLQQIAQHLGIKTRSVYYLFSRKYLTVPQMMKLSELLKYNLFAEYRPNVPPAPDVTIELKKQLAVRQDMDLVLEKRVEIYSQENKKLQTENDLLRELLKERIK